jgi:septum formation protein
VNHPAQLYLASASPRRRELFKQLAPAFETIEAPVDEEALTATFAGPLSDLAEHLARSKAAAAFDRLSEDAASNAGVLAGDTTVLLDGAALGKPNDAAQATAMLQALRDRPHDVVTALAVAEGGGSSAQAAVRSLSVRTRVYMRDYTDAEIAAYLATGDPFDKAGAYAIQHDGFEPVQSIIGCYPNVVGLPLCGAAMLLGVRPPDSPPVVSGCPWSSACRAPLPSFTEQGAPTDD